MVKRWGKFLKLNTKKAEWFVRIILHGLEKSRLNKILKVNLLVLEKLMFNKVWFYIWLGAIFKKLLFGIIL